MKLLFFIAVIFIVFFFMKMKESFGNIPDTCILLTTCVNIKTDYSSIKKGVDKSINTPEFRLKLYTDSINKWLKYTNFDIKIVESSDYPFNQYKSNPRVQVYSFKSDKTYTCKACPQTPYEAESILLAFKNMNLSRYDKIIKVTGKYFLPNFEKYVNDIPNNAEIFFQNSTSFNMQNSEFFGCKTKFLEEIMNLIFENSKKDMNFEQTLYSIKDKYKVYRFPPIKLDSPIQRSGDGKVIISL